MPPKQNGALLNGTTSGSAITRTPSFAPITPIVKESIGDVANKLNEVGGMIEALNLQSAVSETRSPTLDDLRQEISSLSQEIADTKTEQDRKIKELRDDIKNNVKRDIKASMSQKIARQIEGAVRAQVTSEMQEWGNREETVALVNDLKKMVHDNESILTEAEVMLENSRARHNNSTLDEHMDFVSKLSKIKLNDGTTSENFPTSLKVLFSYDEKQVLQLLKHYGLQPLVTDIENLNRFLAFIGLKFTIPDQSLGFLEDSPPAYQSPDILKSPVPSDQSQRQTIPETPVQQPVEVKAKVEESLLEENQEKPHVTPPPVPVPMTRNRPEEREHMTQPREPTSQAAPDDPLRGNPRAERTMPPVPQPTQSRPTQPHGPANNSQYIRQQGRPTLQQQRQQEKTSSLGYLWKSITGDDN